MSRRFLPALRSPERQSVQPAPAAAGTLSDEMKVVLADYYSAMTSSGLYSAYRARPWPVERAVAEAYERLVWVFKAIEAISGHSSRLPFRLKQGDNVLDDHPLYKVMNKRANPLETGHQFRKRLSAQILLSKRGAFVEVTKNNGGDIIRLDLLPPGRTRPIPGTGQELLSHYQVLRADGTLQDIDPENVRWFRDPHPLDPYSGTTPLEAAGLSVELDFFSRLFNVQFLKNDARPGGVLGIKGDMSEPEMNRIEGRFGKGPAEAGKLTVIAGEVTYTDLAASPRDMQHGETAKIAKTEILTAFGVAESVIGYAADRTFDNAEQELYNFWTITMPPHLEMIAASLDDDSNDDLEGFFDTEKVEVLQRPKIARRAEAREEFNAGLITPAEYREPAGYDPIDMPDARALYLPAGKTRVATTEADQKKFDDQATEKLKQQQALMAPAPGAPAIPPGGGKPPLALAKGGSGGTSAAQKPPPGKQPALPAGKPPAAPAVQGKVLAPGRRPPLRLIIRDRETKASDPGAAESTPDPHAHDQLEAALTAALTATLTRLVERTAARVVSPKTRKGTRHWVGQYAVDTRVGTKALDAGRTVDEQRWREDAETTVQPIVAAAAMGAATGLLDDLGAPVPGEMAASAVRSIVGRVVSMVGDFVARIASHIEGVLASADAAGKNVEEIAAAIRNDDVGQFTAGWAANIAAAATAATLSGARDGAATALSEQDPNHEIVQQWRARKDDKVRATHRKADGQMRPMGEPFVVGDALLRSPGDPAGPPGETRNCRCVVNYRSKRLGQYAPKPAPATRMVVGGTRFAVRRSASAGR